MPSPFDDRPTGQDATRAAAWTRGQNPDESRSSQFATVGDAVASLSPHEQAQWQQVLDRHGVSMGDRATATGPDITQVYVTLADVNPNAGPAGSFPALRVNAAAGVFYRFNEETAQRLGVATMLTPRPEAAARLMVNTYGARIRFEGIVTAAPEMPIEPDTDGLYTISTEHLPLIVTTTEPGRNEAAPGFANGCDRLVEELNHASDPRQSLGDWPGWTGTAFDALTPLYQAMNAAADQARIGGHNLAEYPEWLSMGRVMDNARRLGQQASEALAVHGDQLRRYGPFREAMRTVASTVSHAVQKLAARLTGRVAEGSDTNRALGSLAQLAAGQSHTLRPTAQTGPPAFPNVSGLAYEQLAHVAEAVRTATRNQVEYNGAREYRQLNQLWHTVEEVLGAEHRGAVADAHGDPALLSRIDEVSRPLAIEACNVVSRLSHEMAGRLASHGNIATSGYNAVRNLSDLASLAATSLDVPGSPRPSRLHEIKAQVEALHGQMAATGLDSPGFIPGHYEPLPGEPAAPIRATPGQTSVRGGEPAAPGRHARLTPVGAER